MSSENQPPKREGLKALARSAFDLLATLGLYSKDEELRRSSQNFMALQAKNRLEREQANQTDALQTLVAQAQRAGGTTPGNPAPPQPAIADDPVSQIADFMRSIQRHGQRPGTREEHALYATFIGRRCSLAAEAEVFGMGACHIGRAVALAERAMPETSPADLAQVREILSETQAKSRQEQAINLIWMAASEIADEPADSPRGVAAIPGPFQGQRAGFRRPTLSLLTSPGAAFSSRPPGITDNQLNYCWDFGFAVVCVAECSPALAATAGLTNPA